MAGRDADRPRDGLDRDQLDAVMAGLRVLAAISARSLATVGDDVDLTQLRMLMVLAGRESMSLTVLACAAGLTVPTASRLYPRLVAAGLVDSTTDPTNRRQLALTITSRGLEIVRTVQQRRAEELVPLLENMPPKLRARLTQALREFATAASEPARSDLWKMGWVPGEPR